VKNYAFFLKSEEFDKREFHFANKMLTSKSKEDFGGFSAQTKYKPPPFKIAQLNEVKIDANVKHFQFF